jgi:hypothetical protein
MEFDSESLIQSLAGEDYSHLFSTRYDNHVQENMSISPCSDVEQAFPSPPSSTSTYASSPDASVNWDLFPSESTYSDGSPTLGTESPTLSIVDESGFMCDYMPFTAIETFDDNQGVDVVETFEPASPTTNDHFPLPSSTARGRKNAPPRRHATAPPHNGQRLACHLCSYVQRQKRPRKKDLERHIESKHGEYSEKRAHLKEGLFCLGVPVNSPEGQQCLRENPNAEIRVWNGISLVGGCGRKVSRLDSLARHVKTMKGLCWSDLTVFKKEF